VRPRTNSVAKVIDKNRLTGGKLVGSAAAFDGDEQNRIVFFSPLKSTSRNRKRFFPFLISSYNCSSVEKSEWSALHGCV